MRKGMWGLAVVAAGLVPSLVLAQQPSLLLGSVNGTQIINKPVDLSNIVAPVSQPNQFTLASFLPRLNLSLFSTKSTSPLPPPSAFPSTFYPNTFQPLAPIKPLNAH